MSLVRHSHSQQRCNRTCPCDCPTRIPSARRNGRRSSLAVKRLWPCNCRRICRRKSPSSRPRSSMDARQSTLHFPSHCRPVVCTSEDESDPRNYQLPQQSLGWSGLNCIWKFLKIIIIIFLLLICGYQWTVVWLTVQRYILHRIFHGSRLVLACNSCNRLRRDHSYLCWEFVSVKKISIFFKNVCFF